MGFVPRPRRVGVIRARQGLFGANTPWKRVRFRRGPPEVARLIEELGVGFLFAPQHHSAMKHAIGPRKALGLRTLFNLLGPLTNPALAPNQVLGVFAAPLVRPIAEVMEKLGSRHVMVVHSSDGLDEISPAAPTHVAELKDGAITEYQLDPAEFGQVAENLDALIVSDAAGSLAIIESVLAGDAGPGHAIVALNAGAAIYVSGQADSLAEGIARASEILYQGRALERLRQYAKRSQGL